MIRPIHFIWICAAMVAAPFAHADPSAGRMPEGAWSGSIMGLRLVVHIERGAGGGLSGKLDSPDQGAMGLAIDTLVFTGDSLRFLMRRINAGYVGAFTAAGDSVAGVWSQGGMTLPLGLRRLDRAPDQRRPQDPVPPYPYDTLDVVYDNAGAGVRLAGTLTTPRGAGPFPGVVLITGSGAQNRDAAIFGHRVFKVLADHLTRRGIAVLRVDDRGVGGSTGDPAAATSEDFAGDALAGVTFLKTRREIDPRRIGLVGHSEGGLIAPLAATRSPDVAFIVLLAGPGLPGDSILVLQSAASDRLLRIGEVEIARRGAAHRRLHAEVRRGDSAGVVRAARELVGIQTEGATPDQQRALGDLDTLAARVGRQMLSPWMRYFIMHDPRPTLAKVRCPALALIGSRDFQVPPKENLAAIATALRRGGNRDATVKELPGLNHLFQTAATGALTEYATIEETIAPAALDEVAGWILARGPRKR